jgi:hypothetical protein
MLQFKTGFWGVKSIEEEGSDSWNRTGNNPRSLATRRINNRPNNRANEPYCRGFCSFRDH